MGVIIRGKKGYVQFIPSKFNFLILRHLTNACRDVHIYIYINIVLLMAFGRRIWLLQH